MTFVEQCKNPKAVSIIIRGGTEHVVDELERAMDDALRVVGVVVEDKKIVAGGGAPEIELAPAAPGVRCNRGRPGQLAIEAFASAMEIIPKTLAENAGLDPIDMLVALRAEHEKGGRPHGPRHVFKGKPVDMLKAGRRRAAPGQDPGHRLCSRGRGHDPADRRRHRRLQGLQEAPPMGPGGMPPGGMGGMGGDMGDF